MARARIELTPLQQQQVEKAFRRGDSNNRISCTLGVSQKVWERALRERMGDEAFEAQMATNLKANRRLGRTRQGAVSPCELRPEVRATIDKIKGRDLKSKLERRQQVKEAEALGAAAAVTAEDEAATAAQRLQKGRVRRSGETTPVVCIESAEAFGSIHAAAKGTGLEAFRIRRSVYEGLTITGPEGLPVRFRRWKEGDPPVAVRPMRKALVLRFEDGSCWPSITALCNAMGTSVKYRGRFYRRLKELGYGSGSAPLPLVELRIAADQLPMVERQRLEDRISACRSTG